MTVRAFVLLASCALAFGVVVNAGCNRRAANLQVSEVEDPLYQEGKALLKQGREGEALNAFLKVIEVRGLRATPESHLEAGRIYLTHLKNPIRAIYHFESYLELAPPKSSERALVQGLIVEAKREFAKTLPARPLEDQSAQLEATEELQSARREIEELRAEVATLRGGGAAPVSRGPKSFGVPIGRAQVPSPAGGGAMSGSPAIAFSAAPVLPEANAAAQTPPPSTSGSVFSAAPTPSAPVRSAPTPPSASTRNAPARGRTHTVAQSDSLWSIARKYYGSPTAAQVRGIYEANRAQMKNETDLKPGMTLRIP